MASNLDYTIYKVNTDKIGIISDLHMNTIQPFTFNCAFEDCIISLKSACEFFREQGVGLIILNGDNVDHTLEINYKLLSKTLYEIYGSPENAPKFIFVKGNHEFMGIEENEGLVWLPNKMLDAYGLPKKYLQEWAVEDMWDGAKGGEDKATVVVQTNSATVIGYSPDVWYDEYSSQSVERLEKILADAKAKSNKPIILAMHEPISNYLYSGFCDVFMVHPSKDVEINMRYKRLNKLFAKYPSLVVCTGHSHCNELHGRNISQDDGYTSINVGPSVCSAVYPYLTDSHGLDPYGKDGMLSKRKVFNRHGPGDLLISEGEVIHRGHTAHQGLLLTYEGNGLKVDRVNLSTKSIYSDVEPYFIPNGITLENKNKLFNYLVVNKHHEGLNNPLKFPDSARVTFEIIDGRLALNFPSVTRFNDVEGYHLSLFRNGKLIQEKYWHSDYCLAPTKPRDYKVSFFWIDYGLTEENIKEFSAVVSAIDFYGNEFTDYSIKS